MSTGEAHDPEIRAARKKLGKLLMARRARINPRFRFRPGWVKYTTERGLKARILQDLEQGARANFSPPTQSLIEDLYQLPAGWYEASLTKVLNGEDPRPLPEPKDPLAAKAQAEGGKRTSSREAEFDLEALGLDPHDPDVQKIISMRHLNHRTKLRWLLELADIVAEEAKETAPGKDESPQQGSY